MNRHEEKRFWKKVIKGPTRNACWLWVGAIGDDGYGRFWTQAETGKQCMLRAHRAAAEIIYGHNAIAEKLVTHLCDNHSASEQKTAGKGTSSSAPMPKIWPSAKPVVEAIYITHSGSGRATRAASARLLRDLTLTYGYDQHQVDELVRGIIMTGQIPLF